jgi:neopullulanase
MPTARTIRSLALRLLALASFLGLACIYGVGQTSSGALRIDKIEPPNWWIGLPDPMLLITGENLHGARASTDTRGVRVVRTADGLNGHHLFVWLEIKKDTSPGSVRLDISSPNSHQETLFPLSQRNPAGKTFAADAGFNGFSPQDVIYLIMPDRFDDGDVSNNFPESGAYDRNAVRAYHGGDLRGIQQRLPYLKDLGVTAIWITPIYQNDDRTGRDYHGYGPTDLYAVEKHLGTLDDYRSLVKSAHEQGMKMLLDIVPNHVGPTNPWVDDPPTNRWFHGTRHQHLAEHSSFKLETDPNIPFEEWRDVLEGWFANILPDMGTDDDITSQYLRQNALWWTESGGIDGIRLDTFPYVDRKFWHDFHADIHETYPRVRTVGEVLNPDPSVTAYFVGGKVTAGIDTGLDTVFDYPLESAIRNVVLHDSPAGELEEILRDDWMFPRPENLVTFIGNHDTDRFMGEAGASKQKLKLAFSLLLTMRGIPQIYYADEIGIPGGGDPENRHDFPGGFPGDGRTAFTSQGRTQVEEEIFVHVRALLTLRKEHAALRGGKLEFLFSDDRTYVFLRESSGEVAGTKSGQTERLLIVMNNGDALRTIDLDIGNTPIAGARAIATLMGTGNAELVGGHLVRVPIAARTLNIYRID